MGRPMLHPNSAEPAQLNPIATRQGSGNLTEHGADDLLNFARKEVRVLVGDSLYEFGLDHRRVGVTHPTVLKSITRLKREGLVTSRPYRGIFLTKAGHELAERVRARHRLMVELLLAVGVPVEAAEADAEGMEHHASEATLEAFARFLARRK
jgi:hypothetical protein